MYLALLIFFIVVIVILVVWILYNFVWLSQKQVYLVVRPTAFAYDAQDAQNIAGTFGAQLATYDQLAASLKLGLSVCAFGWVQCPDATKCNGNPNGPFLVMSANGSIPVGTCASGVQNNVMVNNYPGNAYGYWLYGSKPAYKSISNGTDVITIYPFHDVLGSEDVYKFNQYEILGIPKVL